MTSLLEGPEQRPVVERRQLLRTEPPEDDDRAVGLGEPTHRAGQASRPIEIVPAASHRDAEPRATEDDTATPTVRSASGRPVAPLRVNFGLVTGAVIWLGLAFVTIALVVPTTFAAHVALLLFGSYLVAMGTAYTIKWRSR